MTGTPPHDYVIASHGDFLRSAPPVRGPGTCLVYMYLPTLQVQVKRIDALTPFTG